MRFPRFFTLLIFISTFIHASAQQVPIGQWRDQLPYSLCNAVTDGGDRIYASTPYAVFYRIKEDNSVVRMNKITGLSDIGISTINYNKDYKTLVIAYTNANIDLIKENRIINISDIKRKQILGNKTINDICFIGKDAYLSCGFGIVVLDIAKEEIRETYYIGSDGSQVNVLSLTRSDNDTLFAGTEKGIYKAWASDPNLANFASWHKDPGMDTIASYNTIATFDGKIFTSKRTDPLIADTMYYYSVGRWSRFTQDNYWPVMQIKSDNNILAVAYNYLINYFNPGLSVNTIIWDYSPGAPFPLDAIADAEGKFWVADSYAGLIGFNKATGEFSHTNLGGPLTPLAYDMEAQGNEVYVVPGGKDASYIPIFTQPQVYHFNNTSWNNITGNTSPILSKTHDLVTVAVNPKNVKEVYAGTYGSGLLQIVNDSAVRRFTEGNSTLKHHTASDTSDVRVGGVTFDKEGRLWVVTSHNNSCLSVKVGDQWTPFVIPIVNENDLGQIIVDKYGQKWIQMRYGNMNPNSLLVFSDNNTINNPADDQAILLNSSVGSGNIPGNNVFALAEDHNGQIWIGTEKGIAVFYSPENVFSGYNFDAQQITVTQGGYVQYLLENETVTAIAVDGANRKWVGTDRGGAYLFSEDGTKQIYHFTAESTPLLSDRISCITINQDGEVFFGTDKGIISFRASATQGADTFGDVYAFPNPVKPDYEGYIAIKGLVTNAQVRITDVNGALVYTTRAEGGQAVWNGKNLSGQKARTGVYLVYAANDDASERVVTKILFIN